MTIIAAYQDKDRYWIGSDSTSISGNTMCNLGTKLIDKGGYIIGFCWSYRVADIIRECSDLPKQINNMNDMRVLRDIIKYYLLEDGVVVGSADKTESSLHPVDIIIISPSGIYILEGDYQIHRIQEGYTATGSGYEVSLGALSAAKQLKVDGKTATRLAIKAAIKHSTTCGGKCHLKSISRKK